MRTLRTLFPASLLTLLPTRFEPKADNLTTETHTDTTTTWKSLVFEKGKPVRTEIGVATVTK